MKRNIIIPAVFAAAILACFPGQVKAADSYITAMGGVTWAQRMHFVDTIQYEMFNPYQDYNLGAGPNVLAALGFHYGKFRLEAEAGYQRNSVKTAINGIDGVPYEHPVDAQNAAVVNWEMKGDVSALSLMANGCYDFRIGNRIELYAMAGIGMAQVSLKNVYEAVSIDNIGGYYVFSPNPGPGYSVQENTFAWQVGAGVAVPVTSRIKVDLRFRYFATADFTLAGEGSFNYATISNGTKDGITKFTSHSVMLGLRVGI